MKRYPKLKCSICGYIPDDEDIELTDFNISKCDTCGQEDVCDLCRFHSSKIVDGDIVIDEHCSCSKCDSSVASIGKNRKFWLKEDIEYSRRKMYG